MLENLFFYEIIDIRTNLVIFEERIKNEHENQHFIPYRKHAISEIK